MTALFGDKTVPSFALLSKSSSDTILLVDISKEAALLFSEVEPWLCKFCLLVSMVVSRAVFYSLIVKDQSSFTITNDLDTVRLLHSFCAMAFPVECVASVIENYVVVSAPVVFDSDWELSRVVYTTGSTSYQARIILYGLRPIIDGSRPISDEPSICYAISTESLTYRRIACHYVVRWTHSLMTAPCNDKSLWGACY